ncbi:hypothetical protein Tco_1047904 [Tanacetum coccineum]
MSDSEHSTVTYTSISSDYEEPSDVGSPRVMVYRYDGLPMHPPSPDYVPGPEHPPSLDHVSSLEHPPSPVYVPNVSEPAYPEFMPPEDNVFPAEEQPLPSAVSPTADSLDDDDEEEESFEDDADDEEEEEDEDEEEEVNLAPADSVPPSISYHCQDSIRAHTPIPFPSEAEVDRLLAIPTPPPSPLTSLSSPLPQIPSPSFPVPSPLTTSPTDVGAPLGYRAVMIRLRPESPSTSHPLPLPPLVVLPHTKASMVMMRAAAPSTYILAPRSETPPSGTPPLLPIPLPTTSPPLLLPSTDCRADVLKVMLPPRKRLYIAPGPRYEIGECSYAPTARPTIGFRADYGHDTDEVYGRLDDAQDDRSLMSDQLNLLCRDRRSHARTARLMKSEARASPQQTEIGDLRAADCRRQAQLIEALTLMRTLLTQMKMAPKKRTTRASPATITTTTPVTNAQLKALIDQGIVDALVARDADRSRNGYDTNNSGTDSRRIERTAHECTYTNFLKC